MDNNQNNFIKPTIAYCNISLTIKQHNHTTILKNKCLLLTLPDNSLINKDEEAKAISKTLRKYNIKKESISIIKFSYTIISTHGNTTYTIKT